MRNSCAWLFVDAALGISQSHDFFDREPYPILVTAPDERFLGRYCPEKNGGENNA